MKVLLLRSVLALLLAVNTLACTCLPDSLELEGSLKRNDAAARIRVLQEATPKGSGINDDRYWYASVKDVFQGCDLVDVTTKIVLRTGGNSALCGVVLQEDAPYVLIGSTSVQTIKELDYTGIVLSLYSCTFLRPWSMVTPEQREVLFALEEPKCNVPIDCKVCPDGYFDGCNTCRCGTDETGNVLAGCTKKFCPPGTETEPFCLSPPKACCDPMQQPGFGDNPICFEGSACCPDGEWSCSIGDGKTFPCGGQLITQGFGEVCRVPIVCPEDVFTCPDGSSVSRDPNNLCQFPKCEPIFCTADVKLCYDGSFVSRDPSNNCEFFPCPPPSCKNCPFGYNDGCNDCECDSNGLAACTERACLLQGEPECFPEEVVCTADVFECPDGTFVGRDPKNGCAFKDCPLPSGCAKFDGCYLEDLTTQPSTVVELQAKDSYTLVEGHSEYSVYCEAAGHLDQVTFFYPNGEKKSHKEWRAPWYMRGDSTNWINRVPFLDEGCGKKTFTVEGRIWTDVCFSVTMELEAEC